MKNTWKFTTKILEFCYSEKWEHLCLIVCETNPWVRVIRKITDVQDFQKVPYFDFSLGIQSSTSYRSEERCHDLQICVT